MINTSLTSVCVPTVFKYAVTQPLTKKHNLDPLVLSNFRPISELPFPSKVLAKVVLEQLQSHLDSNGILEKFQSGFKSGRRTETALLRILNEFLLTVDCGNCCAGASRLDCSFQHS